MLEAAQADCSWKTKQTTRWAYLQDGQLDKLRIWNGAVTDNADITQVAPAAGVTVKESHDVSYLDGNVYVNGNRTSDKMQIDGPNTACNTSTCTANYTYDARDKLTSETNGHGGSIDYKLDPHGNLKSQTADGHTTSYVYDGDQLQSVTSDGGKPQKYWYDDRGRVQCITVNGSQNDCHQSAAPASVVADYSYDYLDRLLSSQQYLTDGTTSYKDRTTKYVYDALSRVAQQNEQHWRYANGAGGAPDPTAGLVKQTDRKTDYSYLGSSQLVSHEAIQGGSSTSKDYLYDAYGHSIGLTDKRTSGKQQQYTYGEDVHGSIQVLLDETGKAQASYGFTAYGDADKAVTKENNPDYDPSVTNPADDRSKQTQAQDDPLNAYRYTGKRFDSGANDINMGARHFGPGERFLQPDQYQNALGDMDLATDPLSGNRYALAGGNPLSFVEVDGHMVMADTGGGAAKSPRPHRRRSLGGRPSLPAACAPYKSAVCNDLKNVARQVATKGLGTSASYLLGRDAYRASIVTGGVTLRGVERMTRLRALIYGRKAPSGFNMALKEIRATSSTGVELQGATRDLGLGSKLIRGGARSAALSAVLQPVTDKYLSGEHYSLGQEIGRTALSAANAYVGYTAGATAAAGCEFLSVGTLTPVCIGGGIVFGGVVQWGSRKLVFSPLSKALGLGGL